MDKTIEYNEEEDKLIYLRKLKEGPGDSIYGLEIAKYILHDDDFIKKTMVLRNIIIDRPKSILKTNKT